MRSGHDTPEWAVTMTGIRSEKLSIDYKSFFQVLRHEQDLSLSRKVKKSALLVIIIENFRGTA
jgi:hypothetical protein